MKRIQRSQEKERLKFLITLECADLLRIIIVGILDGFLPDTVDAAIINAYLNELLTINMESKVRLFGCLLVAWAWGVRPVCLWRHGYHFEGLSEKGSTIALGQEFGALVANFRFIESCISRPYGLLSIEIYSNTSSRTSIHKDRYKSNNNT